MQEVVPKDIDIHGYADDHALKKSFAGSSRNEEANTIETLQCTIKLIKDWMDLNRLRMNNDKTEFVLIGSRQQLNKAETSVFNINGELITRSKSIKYLGADLDEKLTFKDMINRKCRTAMGNLQKTEVDQKKPDNCSRTSHRSFRLCQRSLRWTTFFRTEETTANTEHDCEDRHRRWQI